MIFNTSNHHILFDDIQISTVPFRKHRTATKGGSDIITLADRHKVIPTYRCSKKKCISAVKCIQSPLTNIIDSNGIALHAAEPILLLKVDDFDEKTKYNELDLLFHTCDKSANIQKFVTSSFLLKYCHNDINAQLQLITKKYGFPADFYQKAPFI